MIIIGSNLIGIHINLVLKCTQNQQKRYDKTSVTRPPLLQDKTDLSRHVQIHMKYQKLSKIVLIFRRDTYQLFT